MAEVKNMAEYKNKPLEIVVDDGLLEVPIKNKQGEQIGLFRFAPTDIGLIDRYNELVDKFDDITAPLESININPDGSTDEDNAAAVEAMNEAKRRLYEACDYMFGGNMSEAFFGTVHPFSPVNGYFYCENALEAVGRFISAQFDHETRKIDKRVRKYTNGYHGYKTGKHKGGKKK